MDERDRVMGLFIDHNLLLTILQGKARLVDFDLPDDAQVVGVDFSARRRGWVLLIQSRAFELVSPGEEAPMLPPIGVMRVSL